MLTLRFIHTIAYDQLGSYIPIYSVHCVVSDFPGEGLVAVSVERVMKNSIKVAPRQGIS